MPRAQTHTANIKMKKKSTKKVLPPPINNDSDSDSSEGDVTLDDPRSDSHVDITEDDKSEVLEASEKPQNTNVVSKFNRKFLDYFWKLSNSDEASRLNASLDIIKHLQSQNTSKELHYTVCRLVQGLASNKQCSRHGYYVTFLAVLEKFSVSQLTNDFVLNTIRTKLKPLEAPTKREHVDQTLAQVLAYGTLLKSGRLLKPGEIKQTVDCMLAASKRRAFMPAVAYGFLAELPQQVSEATFKSTLWPILKPIVAKPLSQHNLDTFNLLMVMRGRFPTLLKNQLPDDSLASSDLSNPECFKELTKFIRNTPSESEHPLYGRIAQILAKAGTLCDFWLNHYDPSLFSLKPSKAKTALHFLTAVIKAVDENLVEKLLTKNITGIFINGLREMEDALHPAAENALKAISAVVTKEDVAPEAQRAIVEQLLKTSGYIFDSVTDTRFIHDASSSFKKETVVGVSELYRQFMGETTRKFDRVAVLHHFIKLIHLPIMVRETEWKASCMSFFARWAYFTQSVSPQVLGTMKEIFHKSLDSPCRSLKDLAVLLGLVYDQVNELVPDSELPEVVKSTWSNASKSVKNIQKRQKKTKGDSWVDQTFLILYYNMTFELLRDPVMPSEIIIELDTCYAKANERQSTRRTKQETSDEEPQWLQVITDILLSLLSRDQHLLRSVVVLVWSLLAEHLNKDAVQQVLDVLDPTKSEMPLVEEDNESGEEEDEEEEGDDESGEEEQKADEENGEDGSDESEDDEMVDDDMDDDLKETAVDKLRMKIHEALGDSAALTDTESVDMDALSDTQMESLDRALGAAFKEFRKVRPMRKKNKKMPKDQTSLMHFRLRCLDLVEVLGDKEVSIEIIAAAMLSLISLLEFTVKEPLQKPLMTRTGAVLRKLTNVRHFKGSPEETTEILDKLLQTLFQKPYIKRSLTPYISEDLVHCCSFALRSAVHLIPPPAGAKSKKQQPEPGVKLDKIFQQYKTNMSKFFRKRDSPVPFGIFTRALAYPWPDAGLFIAPLTEFAFSANIINNRKLQAFHLLTALFRNATALAALGQPLLSKLVEDLVQHSQRVLDEAGADSKPKYFHELLVLLRTVIHCPQLDGGKAGQGASSAPTVPPELCDTLKQSLIAFRSKGLAKQKDLRKAHGALCRALGIDLAALAEPAQTAAKPGQVEANEPKKEGASDEAKEPADSAQPSPSKATNGVIKKKKTKRGKHAGQLEKKEAKKRRMEAAAEGFTGVTFPTASADIQVPEDEAPDASEPPAVDEPRAKKTPNKKAIANRVGGELNQAERVESTPSKQKKQLDADHRPTTGTPRTPKRPNPVAASAATPSSAKKPKKTPMKTPKRSVADE